MLQLSSWPMPDLSFVRIGGRTASGSENNTIRDLIVQGYQRVYRDNWGGYWIKSMEQLLTCLHSRTANLCFATIGSQAGVEHYIGVSTSVEVCHRRYATLIATLGCSDLNITAEPVMGELMRTHISPLARHIGVVTGLPGATGASPISPSELLARLVSGMKGQEFGMVVLAVPIPAGSVYKEESELVDMIDRARKNLDPKVKELLGNVQPYLEHIQLGTSIGLWQVGVYFFSPNRRSFQHLQSLISAIYGADIERSMPLQTAEIDGLRLHLEQFGLIKDQVVDKYCQTLRAYKFLTPLNSRSLATYIDFS
jgi:hypothetical protein